MNWSNYECDGQMSIFDLLDNDKHEIKSEMSVQSQVKILYGEFESLLKKCLISHGTGYVDGKSRVHKIIQGNGTDKEKQDALKKEFGIGGFSSAPKENETGVYALDTFSGNMHVRYVDSEGEKEAFLSWKDVHCFIQKWVNEGDYFDSAFYPEDIEIEKHYLCNGYIYLKIARSSAIYSLLDMEEENLYLVYTRKTGFELVSVTKAKQMYLEMTRDEENIINNVGYHYRYGLSIVDSWNLLK